MILGKVAYSITIIIPKLYRSSGKLTSVLQQKYAIDSRFHNLATLSGEMDSELAKIDQMLTDENLFQLLQVAWSKRYPHTTKTGRNSTPVEVILRMLALKHLRSLSYEKLIKNVSESLILRQ